MLKLAHIQHKSNSGSAINAVTILHLRSKSFAKTSLVVKVFAFDNIIHPNALRETFASEYDLPKLEMHDDV